MSVEQTDVVDVVSQAKNGDCILSISDHLEWGDDGSHLLVLQEKLNRYLSFIEGGELVERFPKYKGVPVTIRIYLKYWPNAVGDKFLQMARNAIEGAGFGFEYEHFVAPEDTNDAADVFAGD
jgi:hypothetical protein